MPQKLKLKGLLAAQAWCLSFLAQNRTRDLAQLLPSWSETDIYLWRLLGEM
jgi:hypothetical protein